MARSRRDATADSRSYKCTVPRSYQGSISLLVRTPTHQFGGVLQQLQGGQGLVVCRESLKCGLQKRISILSCAEPFSLGPCWQCDTCRKQSGPAARVKRARPASRAPKASTSYRRPPTSLCTLAFQLSSCGHRSHTWQGVIGCWQECALSRFPTCVQDRVPFLDFKWESGSAQIDF